MFQEGYQAGRNTDHLSGRHVNVLDLVRLDEGGRPSYLLHCERSSGLYLAGTLLDVGRGRGLTDAGAPEGGYVIS